MARESGCWEGKIEGLTQEGLGVGTVILKRAGKMLRRPIFVPFTVPGDIIVADITEQKRKYLFGEISAVLQESSHRVVPACKHFMTCGGCNLEHVSYEEQLNQKAKHTSFLLRRKGIGLPHDIRVLPSEQRHNYRWRSRVAVRLSPDGCRAGFRRLGSKEIVPVEQCFIVHERIVEVISLLNEAGCTIPLIDVEATIVVGERGKAGVLVHIDEVPLETRQSVKSFFEDVYARNRSVIGNVFFEEDGRIRSYGQVQEHFTYQLDGLTMSFLPTTFIQANVRTNTALVGMVEKMLFSDPEPSVVIDLYAGIGNFSLPIARRAREVLAVEGNEQSVLAGTTNALHNDIRNVTFFHQNVDGYLREFAKRYKRGAYSTTYPKADAIILDPPRTGLTPTILKALLSLELERLIYVSCNPTVLATDLRTLQSKYTVSDIACIDMFPDTNHMETVVQLSRHEPSRSQS